MDLILFILLHTNLVKVLRKEKTGESKIISNITTISNEQMGEVIEPT